MTNTRLAFDIEAAKPTTPSVDNKGALNWDEQKAHIEGDEMRRHAARAAFKTQNTPKPMN